VAAATFARVMMTDSPPPSFTMKAWVLLPMIQMVAICGGGVGSTVGGVSGGLSSSYDTARRNGLVVGGLVGGAVGVLAGCIGGFSFLCIIAVYRVMKSFGGEKLQKWSVVAACRRGAFD